MHSVGVSQASGDADRIAFALSAMLKLGGTGIPDMTTGKDIAARRQAMDMTQGHLAGAAGVSRSTVQRAERGLPISAESMRSIRSVLGLTAVAIPQPEPQRPDPNATTVRDDLRTSTLAWYADLALVMPLFWLVTLGHYCGVRFLEGIAWRGAGPDMGRILFYVVMTTSALMLPLVTLSGRILWRRMRHPTAECLVIGVGKNDRWEFQWVGVRVRICRWPIPLVRWSSRGRLMRTWPGAVMSLALVPAAIMTMHLKPVAIAFEAAPAHVGYSNVREIVPAWRVEPDSPLAEAGFTLGDRVVSIGGIPVLQYMDVWPAIRDGRDDVMDVVVQRVGDPIPGVQNVFPTSSITLHVRPRARSGGLSCPQDLGCRWIGDIGGFLAPEFRAATTVEFLQRFGQELVMVGKMAADPSMAGHAAYEEKEGRMSIWARWVVFQTASDVGLRLLGVLMTLFVLGASLLPPFNRTVRAIVRGLRARSASPDQMPSAFLQA